MSVQEPNRDNRPTIDLNTLLMWANVVVAGLLIWVQRRTEGNPYVDGDTVWLGLGLCAQTLVALWIERRRRDPFVILLVFEIIFYYELRICTLTLYPYSDVFNRFPYGPADSNYALIYIIVANFFLYAGLFCARSRRIPAIEPGEWRAIAPHRVVLLLVFAITFTYFSGLLWTEEETPRVFNVIGQFLGANIVVLLSLSFYFLFRKSLGRGFGFAIGLLIVLDMVAHTLAGSRSTIVIVVQQCLLVTLALHGRVQIPRRYVAVGVLMMPLFVGLLVAAFAISSINRSNRENTTYLDVGAAFRVAKESSANLATGPDLDVILQPVFARAGFFDYAAELIAHRKQYSGVINLTSYAESLIDNLLTPGFDLFDAPRIANALIFVYMEGGEPSKMRVLDQYQSDQLDVYGEFYCLFGYGSLPLLFIVAYAIKKAYLGVKTGGPYRRAVTRVIILLIFLGVVRSFGIDWVIIEAVPVITGRYLYARVFANRRLPATPLSVAP
jgi:hypothetical protein